MQLPSFDNIHTLSVSRESISSITFNETGDWIALGCAALGQLLVWEWRSESYILKQQGHYHDIATAAFSPDGLNLVTGADDAKVSLDDASATHISDVSVLLGTYCMCVFACHDSLALAMHHNLLTEHARYG